MTQLASNIQNQELKEGKRKATVATIFRRDEIAIRHVIAIEVHDGAPIEVAFKNTSESETKIGHLSYRPWPEKRSAPHPGLRVGDEWTAILGDDEVFIL